MQPEENVVKLKLELILPNANQPRKSFDDATIDELAASIKEYGILNPILVRKKDNLYEIIAGERRYRAAKKIGLTEVPVIIKNIDETKAAQIALIENLQRENINPIEEAKSYQDIIKASNITEEKLSQLIGKSQSYISNKLRLLKLPQNIQNALIDKKISERHARSLISVSDEKKQTELLTRVINEKLTVKELESIINEKSITESEIQSAINDIMKSLNISNDEIKKEEKESENMNNETSFFNQTNTPTDTSLNNINTASDVAPVPETSAMAIPSFELPPVQPEPAPIVETPAPVMDEVSAPDAPPVTPEITVPTPEPLPTFDIPTPATPNPEVPNPIPSFEPPVAPTITPESALNTPPVAPEPTSDFTAPIIDPPLFTPPSEEVSAPVVPPVTPEIPLPTPEPTTTSFDVPVEAQSELAHVEELLKTNGINYKKYSNETNHCIIIEL